MTLIERLGYRVPEPNRLHTLVQAAASSRVGAWSFSKVLHHFDDVAARLTDDRRSVTMSMAGLPLIELTTIGAKSGKERVSPLVGIPTDGSLAVIGSGWGQKPTPGWVYNLRANPSGRLRYDNTEVAVSSRSSTGPELDAIWGTARAMYAGYAKYPERANHRDIGVFVLSASD